MIEARPRAAAVAHNPIVSARSLDCMLAPKSLSRVKNKRKSRLALNIIEPMRSKEVHLLERPEGIPTLGQFGIVETDVSDPGAGELLVENVYMSVDPAMRPRLAGQTPLNKAMLGGAIGRVLKSRHPGYAEGDLVESMHGFRQYYVSAGEGLSKLDPDGMPLAA